jgi:predicted RNA binding protein YcfA (HicA-like mRNA interferase family)
MFRRSNGSHHLYHHPILNKTIIVPVHGNKDLPKGTFYSILRQAGIEKSGIE